MYRLVTVDILKASNLDLNHSLAELKQMTDGISNFHELCLDEIFAYNSRLEFSEFVFQMGGKCSWLLNAE